LKIKLMDGDIANILQPAFPSQRGPVAKKRTFGTDETMSGILGYRNQNFATQSGEDVNQGAAAELGDCPNEPQGQFGQPIWLGPDSQLPVLTPSTSTMYDKNGSAGAQLTGFGEQNGEGQDVSGSPEGCQSSSGPTPVSSNATGSEARCHLLPGRMQGSGAESFQASPVTPNQNLMSGAGVDVGGHGFLGDANGFAMPGLEDQQGFSANAWGDLPTQGAMPPVGDGVLRALMNMRPMDAMDISTWDTGAEELR
jgi:hypothetical protein